MNKDLIDLQDIKSAFISHCKTLGCEDAYIKVCENKFGNIEKALKDYELLKKCLYVGKSGAIAITSYGFDNHDLLEEILK